VFHREIVVLTSVGIDHHHYSRIITLYALLYLDPHHTFCSTTWNPLYDPSSQQNPPNRTCQAYQWPHFWINVT